MYIFTHRNAPPTSVLSGLGGEDRYIPPKNVDPATGRPIPSEKYPYPWGVAEVGLRDIKCKFYHNSPRELVANMSFPYVMEIRAGDHHFIGNCNPNMMCPASVHQNAPARDPFRERRCAEWKEGRQEEAARIIADPEFRANITERVLNIAGIAPTLGVKPAEFLEVVIEQEARERPIKTLATIGLIASAGILTFVYVRKWAKKRQAKKSEDNVSEAMGDIRENSEKKTSKKRYYYGDGKKVKGRWYTGDPSPEYFDRESNEKKTSKKKYYYGDGKRVRGRWYTGDALPEYFDKELDCKRHGFRWIPGRCAY